MKSDGSEVDRRRPRRREHVRAAIADAFPIDGISGRRGGGPSVAQRPPLVVDPIDGTRSFASGVPLYSML